MLHTLTARLRLSGGQSDCLAPFGLLAYFLAHHTSSLTRLPVSFFFYWLFSTHLFFSDSALLSYAGAILVSLHNSLPGYSFPNYIFFSPLAPIHTNFPSFPDTQRPLSFVFATLHAPANILSSTVFLSSGPSRPLTSALSPLSNFICLPSFP